MTDESTGTLIHPRGKFAVLEDDGVRWDVIACDERRNYAIQLEGMAAVFAREATGNRGTIRRVGEGETFETVSGRRFVVVMTNGTWNLGWEDRP